MKFNEIPDYGEELTKVAPLAGAWIEISRPASR